MNLLIAIAAIAALCGPRNQTPSSMSTSVEVSKKAKDCQVQMIKCVKAKSTAPVDESLVTCMQEI
jgi:hypothetical protein